MLNYIKIYSIDIALGAVVGTWFLARIAGTSLFWYIYLIVGLAVWSIYTVDHLLDAKKLKDRKGPSRYQYHQEYMLPVIILTVLSCGVALFLALHFLPQMLIEQGLILGGVTVVYFLLRLFLGKLFAGLKELVAALVYTSGIALPAFYFMGDFNFFFALVVLQLFCLVFANLLICAVWDEKWDRANSYDSMAVLFGKRFINVILFSLIALALISASSGFFIYTGFYISVQFIILLMGLGLILAYYFGERLGDTFQRLLIDSIFFIPLLLLIL